MTPARGCPGAGTGTGRFRAKIARHAHFQWRPTNYALNCAKNESELECFMGTLNAIHKAITRLPPPTFPAQHMMHTLATHVLETLHFIERRQLSQRCLGRLNEPTMEHL